MRCWIVTIPKTKPWADFLEESAKPRAGGGLYEFSLECRISVERDDRVYFTYQGWVRGWMTALGCHYIPGDIGARFAGRVRGHWAIFIAPGFHALDGPGEAYAGFPGVLRYQPPGELFSGVTAPKSGFHVRVTGETYRHRSQLSAEGYAWNAEARAWEQVLTPAEVAIQEEFCRHYWSGCKFEIGPETTG